MNFSSAAETVRSQVSFFVMFELPPIEPVLSLNTKKWEKERAWVAGLSSTHPEALLVKGKTYTKNNSGSLHIAITVLFAARWKSG